MRMPPVGPGGYRETPYYTVIPQARVVRAVCFISRWTVSAGQLRPYLSFIIVSHIALSLHILFSSSSLSLNGVVAVNKIVILETKSSFLILILIFSGKDVDTELPYTTYQKSLVHQLFVCSYFTTDEAGQKLNKSHTRVLITSFILLRSRATPLPVSPLLPL